MAKSRTLETVIPQNVWIPLILRDFFPRAKPAIFLPSMLAIFTAFISMTKQEVSSQTHDARSVKLEQWQPISALNQFYCTTPWGRGSFQLSGYIFLPTFANTSLGNSVVISLHEKC